MTRQPAPKTLDRVLSRAGLCSRTDARELVAAGRVRVNGAVARSPERRIDLRHDVLEVDGRPLRAAEPLYLALNKPKGYVTTVRDPEGRKTVHDLVAHVGAWVFPVGRLDRDTNGLLLVTNDTAFADRVLDPRSKLPKTYRVRTRAPVTDEQLAALRRGVQLDDGPTLPARVERLHGYKSYAVLEVELTEGRNRQVRRMLKAVGNGVSELRRVAIGPVRLGRLPSGATRPLSPAELRALGVPRARREP